MLRPLSKLRTIFMRTPVINLSVVKSTEPQALTLDSAATRLLLKTVEYIGPWSPIVINGLFLFLPEFQFLFVKGIVRVFK